MSCPPDVPPPSPHAKALSDATAALQAATRPRMAAAARAAAGVDDPAASTVAEKKQLEWPVLIAIALVITIAALAGTFKSSGLVMKTGTHTSFGTLLGTLFFVALFVERVIEFVVASRARGETNQHLQNFDYWRDRRFRFRQQIERLIFERSATPAPSDTRKAEIETELAQCRTAVEEASTQMDLHEKALLPFRAKTRRFSLWVGFFVGVFVSAVGFRFLHQIVDWGPQGSGEVMTKPQYQWFIAADVLLTGVVLAGGSHLIHQLFAAYNAFMESTQRSASQRTP